MGWLDLAERVQIQQQKHVGETIVYTPQGASPISQTPAGDTLTGIYNSAPTAEIVGGVVVRMGTPTLMVHGADLGVVTPAPGDSVLVRSVTWEIGNPGPDGEGDYELELKTPAP